MGDLFCAALRMHYDYFQFRERHHITDEKLKDIHKYADGVKEEKKRARAAAKAAKAAKAKAAKEKSSKEKAATKGKK